MENSLLSQQNTCVNNFVQPILTLRIQKPLPSYDWLVNTLHLQTAPQCPSFNSTPSSLIPFPSPSGDLPVYRHWCLPSEAGAESNSSGQLSHHLDRSECPEQSLGQGGLLLQHSAGRDTDYVQQRYWAWAWLGGPVPFSFSRAQLSLSSPCLFLDPLSPHVLLFFLTFSSSSSHSPLLFPSLKHMYVRVDPANSDHIIMGHKRKWPEVVSLCWCMKIQGCNHRTQL